MQRVKVLTITGVTAVIALFWWLDSSASAGGEVPQITITAEPPTPPTESTPAPLPPLPRDRQGTDVDGELAADSEGHLRVTPDVRHVFDYFLMSSGAESAAVIEARIFAYIEENLPPQAVLEAKALWRKYIAMREAFSNVTADPNRPRAAQAVEALETLTARYFSPAEREALFGDDITRARATAPAMLGLEQNPNMTAQERNAAWDEVTQRLPDQDRKAQLRSTRVTNYLDQEKQMVADGKNPGEVQAVRVKMFGQAAATRLAQLDENRRVWNGRIDAFKAERDAIANNAALSAEERTAQIQGLLEARFEGAEQLRARALTADEPTKNTLPDNDLATIHNTSR